MSSSLQKTIVLPGGKDTSVGVYSPGIACGDMVFVSGQGALDPHTHQIIGETVEQQTEQTLRNVQQILAAAGCSLADCVKVTVHLSDIKHFDRFNQTYAKFFTKPYPVRTTVQSVLHGILVEIDAIAIRGCGKAAV